MKRVQTILGAALLAGASAIASPALAGYHWDPACGCQRPSAYVAPEPYVQEPVVVYRPRVVYRPQVVYEPVPAYVVRVPAVHAHGCCVGRGLFTGFYGHGHHGAAVYGGGYSYGPAYGYGPTD